MKRTFTKKWPIILLMVVAATLLVLSLTGIPQRAYEALALLRDLSALSPSASGGKMPVMMRAPMAYEIAGRHYRADVYRPVKPPRAGIVLLHGAAPLGKDDPQLVEFAAILAGARFVVLVPDLVDLRKLRLRAGASREVADAVLYMLSASNLVPEERVGIAALSVAAGPAVIAASHSEIRDRVQFILAIGGYYDMLATLTFATTGYFQEDGQQHYNEPNDYAKWVLVLSNIDKLHNASDRQLLANIARRKLANKQARINAIVGRLSPEGRVLYRFITNDDPQQTATLFAQLPAEIKAEIQALSLNNRDLSEVRARAILVHGLDDRIIPYTESVALARALSPDRTRLFLVSGLLHVDLKPTLADYWRLWRAVYAVISERDR